MIEFVRSYQSDRGIWHVEIKRGAKLHWFSLKTRDSEVAAKKVADYQAALLRAFGNWPSPSRRETSHD